MFQQVISRLKTRRDARLYERTFLAKSKKNETFEQTSTRLYCEGNDDYARAYELLSERFPEEVAP